MKKLITLIIIFGVFIFSGYSQIIPYGISLDSITVDVPENCQYYGDAYKFYFYKPANYDSLTSPILWYVHGSGGTGAEGPAILTDIAERRNALIISPTMHSGIGGWAYVITAYMDTVTNYGHTFWSTDIFKQIYRYVLERENRVSIPVHITGFSQGAQFVSRYMLVRQFDPDSIPIQMAVSVDPANYTLCTDTFNGNEMDWTFYRCGLAGESPVCYYPPWSYQPVNQLICNSHVKQYYNENYGVLIGTLDTATFQGFCPGQGGNNRYERAIAFYNFSDTNAVTRGTSLQWQYTEVPGVGHDGYALYNTKAMPTDTVTIAEALLFDTPYHIVPDFSPIANYSYADSGLTIDFLDLSSYSEIWHWDFGDGDTSIMQNPQHTYALSGTYYVCLTAGDSCINDTYCDSITVTAVGIDRLTVKNFIELRAYPNPFSNSTIISFTTSEESNAMLQVYNYAGQKVATLFDNAVVTGKQYKVDFNTDNLPQGIYLGILQTNDKVKVIRLSLIK